MRAAGSTGRSRGPARSSTPRATPRSRISAACPPGAPVGRGRIQPFLGIEGGVRASTTTFDVVPPFDVDSTIGVVGLNGGFLYMPTGTNLLVGPRVGVLLGFGSGSIADPPASPGFTYKVEMPWTAFYEAVAGADLGPALFSRNARILGSIGGAHTHTQVPGPKRGLQG